MMMDIKTTSWKLDKQDIKYIRNAVFVIEQNVPSEIDFDGLDDQSTHWLAFNEENKPIGTARIQKDGHFGRMAVLKSYRGLGVGSQILKDGINFARDNQMSEIWLHSQINARGFYERFGFIASGEIFVDAGIDHILMRKNLSSN